jgi:hypothetical protein
MSKTVVYALILIALSVIVLIFSHKQVEVDLIVTTIRATGSLVYLAFIALGVVIGILLK